MAKKERRPLILKEDYPVKTIEDLQEHFDLEKFLKYYKSGELLQWVQERYYEVEEEKLLKLDLNSDTLEVDLCQIFGVESEEAQKLVKEREEKKQRAQKKICKDIENHDIKNQKQVFASEVDSKKKQKKTGSPFGIIGIFGSVAAVIALIFMLNGNDNQEQDVSGVIEETQQRQETLMEIESSTELETTIKETETVAESEIPTKESETLIETESVTEATEIATEPETTVKESEVIAESEIVEETSAEIVAETEPIETEAVELLSVPETAPKSNNVLNVPQVIQIDNDTIIEMTIDKIMFMDDGWAMEYVTSGLRKECGALFVEYTVTVLESDFSVQADNFRLDVYVPDWGSHYNNELAYQYREINDMEPIGYLGVGETHTVVRGFDVPIESIEAAETFRMQLGYAAEFELTPDMIEK